MADFSVHRVTNVRVFVSEPQNLPGDWEKYAVTKIYITTEEGHEHLVTLFGARGFDNPQTAVYPMVELERPNVPESDD
jgi:hypothetical protein